MELDFRDGPGRSERGAVEARAAHVDDFPEIVRLVAQVYRDMHAHYGGRPPAVDAEWAQRLTGALEGRLGRDVGVFVVEGSDGRLVSIAGGRISETLPSPRHEHALEGYIDWVGTDPEHRGRGLASATTSALLEWFRGTGALSVSLTASPSAEAMYERLGFSGDGPRALSISLV